MLQGTLTIHDKRCTDCKTLQPAHAFNRNRSSQTGLQDLCRTCQAARGKKWRQDNPELARERQAASRARNRDYYRNHALRSRTGITLDEKHRMYEQQEGRCAICQRNYRSLDVDHDHRTGRVRALLCNNCNRALGLFQDNYECLQRAATYLEEHSC